MRCCGAQGGRWRGCSLVDELLLVNDFSAMALGMTLILKALQHGSAGLVGMLSSVSPVLLLPLLWWRTGQRPAWGAWLGAAMAVVGCALILA